jgi:asparagine synthase (glutamine-hydrolysing)
MPGLTLWLSTEQGAEDLTRRFRSAQATMRHAPDYRETVELEVAGCRIGHVAYMEYPVRFFRCGSFLIGVEGRVFGRTRSRLESELTDLADRVMGDREKGPAAARRWILANDGDYVVSIVRRDGGSLVVLNDPLGRLPLYFHVGPIGAALARECKFIAALRGAAGLDRLAWAQHLWMGYPLGRRTLFDGISRAPGGFLFRAESFNGRIECRVEELFTFNFDEKDEGPSLSRRASELADAFSGAAANAVATDGPTSVVLSLSGGNDSRSVAAALKRSGVPFSAATYRTAESAQDASGEDSRIAARIAQTLEIPWELIPLRAPDEQDEGRLVWMKDGLNFVGMAFLLNFLEQLAGRRGRGAICVTGDGGDKALPDIRSRRAQSVKELMDVVITEHALLSADVAEEILGLGPGTLRADLEGHLALYPERGFAQKAVHFKVYERGRKWLFEGEDRNRFFLWQASPFYTFSFFRMAMRVPDRLKKGDALYREFQNRLNPALTRIEHAGTGRPIGVPPPGWNARLRAAGRYLPKPLKASARRLIRLAHRGSSDATPGRYAFRAGEVERYRHSVMAFEPVRRMLESASARQYFNWRTLAILEEISSGIRRDYGAPDGRLSGSGSRPNNGGDVLAGQPIGYGPRDSGGGS